MKTRAETKGSILNKSRLIKTQRIRRLHQLAVSSGAACAAAICLWTAASAATRIKKAPSELVTGGYSADSFTGDAMKGDKYNELGNVYNSRYLYPDSMTIQTQSGSEKTIALFPDKEPDMEYIDRLCNWLSDVNTTSDAEKGMSRDTVYIVKRTYGGSVTAAYICGSAIKFDDGEWLTMDQADAEVFQTIIQNIYQRN